MVQSEEPWADNNCRPIRSRYLLLDKPLRVFHGESLLPIRPLMPLKLFPFNFAAL